MATMYDNLLGSSLASAGISRNIYADLQNHMADMKRRQDQLKAQCNELPVTQANRSNDKKQLLLLEDT